MENPPLKDRILRALSESAPDDVSGQALAARFGVSRNAVWKAIRTLRAEGYAIDAGTNRGYRLAPGGEPLSAAAVRAHLPQAYAAMPVYVYASTDSTNNEGKRLLSSGAQAPALVLAQTQTAGRGRRGRSFYSPAGTGLYMTALVPPPAQLAEAAIMTSAAAVATARAIEALTGLHAQIKWVNDLYLHGRKIVGILTEAVTDLESGGVQGLLIGVGVNTATADFPAELREKAGSLCGGVSRSALAARIAGELLALCAHPADRTFMKEYRARCMVLGRTVNYRQDGEEKEALAVDVDDAGGLLIKHADGRTETLRSGEISVRLAERDV